jgi:GH18 family chitinase
MHGFIDTDAKRKTMVSSCVNLINQYPKVFDGLDIDLEYPCLPTDNSCGLGITPTNDDKGFYALLM